MTDVYVEAAYRTAIGSSGGSLQDADVMSRIFAPAFVGGHGIAAVFARA